MKKSLTRIACVALVVIATGCTQLQTLAGRQGTATVTMNDASGALRGAGEVWQDNNGLVHVDLQLQGFTPGQHAIHFHPVGICVGSTTPPFASSGTHFNPASKQHGLNNPAGPHAGDAPNFTVAADGTAHVQFTTDRVTLTPGAASLVDSNGSSIVIHAGSDDQVSQPAGGSGDKIACGVLKAIL